jgi:all-trans-retinol 13,14-reductase
MSITKESRREHYDVAVIGAGIGGLTAAALLAKAGKSVLVVERHRRPGGYAHSFTRRGCRFDAGVHLVSGCGERGYAHGRIVHTIMEALGVAGESPFLEVSPYARACYPGFEISLRAGEEASVAALCAAFPEERDGLRALSRLCRSVAEEIMRADEVLERARTGRTSPFHTLENLIRYRRATLGQVLGEFLQDPRLRGIYASLWPYLGLPPSRLSFLAWATMYAGYTYEGGYYCRGTFQAYADALAASLARNGGELLLGASVRRISVDHGRVTGIVLENGQRIRAQTVVSNADARQTAELLIGAEHLPAEYRQSLDRLSPSLSLFVVYLATDLALERLAPAHESFFYESFDHEDCYARTREGRPDWFSATVPTLADPALAPPGQHILLLTTLCPFQVGASWREAKAPFQEALLDKAERRFPGLAGRLLQVEAGSPRTLERYTLNTQGAAYGWDPTPDQVGPNRPAVQGPLEGLFYAGHWTRPGGGVAGVSVSGVLAAQAVLNVPRRRDFWELLGMADG